MFTKHYLIIALSLFFAFSSNANTIFHLGSMEVSINTVENEKRLAVVFREVSNSPVTIQLINEAGEVLQENKIKAKQNLTLQYHVEDLLSGDYQLVFETPTAEFIQPLKLTKKGIEVEAQNLIEQFKPIFKFENNFLDINAFNKSIQPISVEVTDEEGNKLYKEITKEIVTFGKRFDLNSWEKGDYYITVKMNEKIYYYTVQKK